MKHMKLRTGLLLLLLTLLWAAAASAAPGLPRFVWNVEGKEVEIVPYQKKDQSLYLFLPGALKGRDPVLRLEEGIEFLWGETAYADGSVFPAEQLLGQKEMTWYSTGKRLGTMEIMQGSEIPALFFTLETDDYNRILKGTRFDIKKYGKLVMLSGEGKINAAEKITSMKTHGNSTFFASKKAFQFKMENKVALDGMEKNKKWMLLANWFDISLIRNQITFDLFREIGLTYTPDSRQVELYVNGAYNGTYLLTEKIQLKKGRLEITDLEETLEALNGKEAYDAAKFKKGNGKVVNLMKWFDIAREPEDVSGGYLLEIEKALHFSQMTDEAGFVTDKGMCVVIKEPTHVGYRGAQYIAALVNDFHHAVLQKNGYSKSTGRYYTSFMDTRSFALKIIMEEFTANFDVRAGSHFMYKDRDSIDGLLYAGPAWDYDLSYGNKDDGLRNPKKVDYVFKRSTSEVFLYHWLLTHQDFRVITRQLYEEVFLPAAEVLAGRREPAKGSPLKPVEAYQEAIRESARMNFTRWSARAIPDVWDQSGRTFESAGEFVKNWIEVRLETMSGNWLLDP